MADAIQNRRIAQENVQLIQQEKADKKKLLAEQQREELKELKTKFQELNKDIDQEAQAAVNHIKYESQEEHEALKAERRESRAQTYNRRGQTNDNQNSVSQSSVKQSSNKSSVQNNRSISTEKPTPQVQNYVTKETDQFYKVQDRGSRISESNDGYVIEAYAPEHEKDNLRMSVANNRATLSGKRKFQDSVDEGLKKISTNNFQTFHEEFRFEKPVASEGMTRERHGDFVTFFIPKLEALRFDEES